MPNNENPSQQSTNQAFALVSALTLMAFILTLLVALVIMAQVENQSSSTALADLRAKEAARLALMMALGDLRKHAGPDQRVTARAEITGITGSNRYWTGVWDATDPAAEPHWLVSWIDQAASANPATMQLVGPQTAGSDTTQHVDAPIIEVFGENGAVESEIAWWISDEGIKASVGTLPLNLQDAPNFIENASVDSLQLQIATSHGLEEIFGGYDRFSAEDEEEARALERIFSIGQMLSIGDFADEPGNNFSGEAPFHALTPGSYGVLASTIDDADGGLMRDLSLYPELLGGGIEEFLRFGEEHATSQALASGTAGLGLNKNIQGLDALPSLIDGEIQNPILPILSNFMIAFTLRSHSPTSSNPNFYLRMRFFCEFWNPFTHTLSMRNAGGDDLELELEITGLPEVTVTKTTGTISSSPPINIQNLLADPSNSNNAMVIRLAYDQAEDWLPGRAKNWTGVDASTSNGTSPYTSILDDGKDWDSPLYNLGGATGLDTGVPRLTGDVRHTSTGTNQIDIRVYLVNTNTAARSLVAEYIGYEYEEVSTRPSGYSSTHSGTTFGYHIALRGPHFSSADSEYFRGRWLNDHDPRNPSPSMNSDWYLDNDPLANTGSPYAAVKDGISPLPLPLPAEINETKDTINTVVFRRLMDRSSGMNGILYNVLWQDAPLFEIPRERVLSLASLQHIYIHNERPFQVGNSWATEGDANELEWFDRYYLSGLSRHDVAADFDSNAGLPNPAMITYQFNAPEARIEEWQSADADDDDASRLPAQNLMVANRFNINSTSVAAWKSVLGSLRLNNFNYLDYPENDTSDLSALNLSNANREATFARFSHSLEETYEAPDTPNFEGVEPVAPSAFYRHGARRLDNGQLEALASEIVNLLEARGRPFTSMEEFLSPEDAGLPTEGDASLLEQAIARIFGTGPNGRQQWYHEWETEGTPREDSGEIPIEIDHFSPGFLTQADMMTAIGPMLSTRSDTFKIRARGESFSEQGELLSVAMVEATVQRTPEATDPSVDPAGPTSREFKILNLRWLKEDEI